MVFEQIISIFDQRRKISDRIQQYDIIYGLEELGIYREFNGLESFSSKLLRATKKIKKYLSNEKVRVAKQKKIEQNVLSIL